jgi:hypothetical protein
MKGEEKKKGNNFRATPISPILQIVTIVSHLKANRAWT